MSITALTTEASRLIRVFQDKEDAINAALAVAVATAPDMLLRLYVDSVGGLDTNPGTLALPLQTLDKANSLAAPGHALVLHLARDGEYAFDDAVINHDNMTVTWFGNWTPSFRTVGVATRATITQGATWNAGLGKDEAARYDGIGLSFWAFQCVLKTATKTDAGREFDEYRCAFANSAAGSVVQGMSSCTIDLNDAPCARARTTANVAFLSCNINVIGSAPLLDATDGVCLLHALAMTITPSADLGDLIVGRTNPTPHNVLCNVVID